MFRKIGLAALIIVAVTAGARSQTQAQAPEINVQSLLSSGFAIVAMQYLAQSMVFTLPRHSVAYVCDTTLNGETKICIRLK